MYVCVCVRVVSVYGKTQGGECERATETNLPSTCYSLSRAGLFMQRLYGSKCRRRLPLTLLAERIKLMHLSLFYDVLAARVFFFERLLIAVMSGQNNRRARGIRAKLI